MNMVPTQSRMAHMICKCEKRDGIETKDQALLLLNAIGLFLHDEYTQPEDLMLEAYNANNASNGWIEVGNILQRLAPNVFDITLFKKMQIGKLAGKMSSRVAYYKKADKDRLMLADTINMFIFFLCSTFIFPVFLPVRLHDVTSICRGIGQAV